VILAILGELDLEDVPRGLEGLGRFLRNVPCGSGGLLSRESLMTGAPLGSDGSFGATRGKRRGKQSTNIRLEIFADMWISVQMYMQDCRPEVKTLFLTA
jgi:hypothetical protein